MGWLRFHADKLYLKLWPFSSRRASSCQQPSSKTRSQFHHRERVAGVNHCLQYRKQLKSLLVSWRVLRACVPINPSVGSIPLLHKPYVGPLTEEIDCESRGGMTFPGLKFTKKRMVAGRNWHCKTDYCS